MEFSISDENFTARSCLEHIEELNRDLQPYRTLSLLVPTNDQVWTERDKTWSILFKIATSLLAFSYLVLGLSSTFLIVKKGCLVLSTRTFFAVYLSMAILGFSRAALLVLDPFGVTGFIREPFPGWIVVSRLIGSLGFPSLIAGSTLIILTLIRLVETKPGKQWYERWSRVLPVLCVPYAIALVAEALGHIHTYTALFSGLLCEVLFVVWGLTMCIGYLLAGTRLLTKIDKRYRRATNQPVNRRTRRIKKKIVKITFGTAAAGIFSSLISAGGVVMVLLLIGADCMGFNEKTNSAAWLGVQFLNYISELLLAVCILYSITDVSKCVDFFRYIFLCKLFASRQSIDKESEGNACEEGIKAKESSTGYHENETNLADVRVEVDRVSSSPISPESSQETSVLLEKFTININNSSETFGQWLAVDDRLKITASHSEAAIDKLGREEREEKNIERLQRASLDTELENWSRILSVNDRPPCSSNHSQAKLFRSQRTFQRDRESSVPVVVTSKAERAQLQQILRHSQSETPARDQISAATKEPSKLLTMQNLAVAPPSKP